MSDSKTQIAASLEARFNTVSPALPTAWANEALAADIGPNDPWIEASVAFAQPFTGEVGSAHSAEVGYLEVLIKWQLGVGDGAARAHAALIESYFWNAATILTQDGKAVLIPDRADIGPGYIDGDRWAQPARIRFSCQL